MAIVSTVIPALIIQISELFTTENPWILVPLILLSSFLLARLIEWGGQRIVQRSAKRPNTDTSFNHVFFEEIYVPLYVSTGLLGIYLSLRVVGIVESSNILVGSLLTALVLLWLRTAIRLGNRWIGVVYASDNNYEFAPVLKNIWTIFSVLGAGMLLLSIWEINITPLLASAGIVGIILGLAAQEAIANLIGGVSLYFDDTYKVGDVIVLEGQQRGMVTDIGIRSTTVRTPDDILITVPNSVLNSAHLVNETAPKRRKRIRVPITAAYGTDYQKVEEILLEICEEIPFALESPSPRVLFTEFGDSALVFELQVFIAHPNNEPRTIDQINRRVYDEFNEAGIEIPFPQQDLRVRDPTLDESEAELPSSNKEQYSPPQN
jgi:MscS family membrane protein